MSSSKKIYLQRDFAACVYQSLLTGDTVSRVGIFDPVFFVNSRPSLWFNSPSQVLRPVGDQILQEFNTLIRTRFRTYNC
jgi:hypothetical protein